MELRVAFADLFQLRKVAQISFATVRSFFDSDKLLFCWIGTRTRSRLLVSDTLKGRETKTTFLHSCDVLILKTMDKDCVESFVECSESEHTI